jgi:hypothetical protein
MKRRSYVFVGVLATSLWSMANASPVTFNLGGGGSGQTISSPDTVTQTGQSIVIYGETVNDQANYASMTDDGGAGKFTGGLSLFSVTNNVGGNTASGIAPFNSGTTYTNQNGITESDVLLINLSGITAGSTVSFLMSTGVNATSNTGINVYDGIQSVIPTGIGSGAVGGEGTNPLSTETITAGNVNGSGGGAATKTFTLTGTVGTGAGQFDWIAIQADCHYLLLDTLTVTPGAVPEPSFYGFFALAMVGLVLGARKMRARAAVAATEQA